METNLTLLQKYVDLGFTISRLGRDSSALRFQDRIIFIFGPGYKTSDILISLLCDRYLEICQSRKLATEHLAKASSEP